MARTVALAVLFCVALPIYEVVADEQPAPPPAPDQWIAPIPGEVDVPIPGWREYGMARWVVWPSDDYIAERQPARDRTLEPPALRPAPGREAEPQRWGGESPARASESAARWVRLILRPEWLPEDLDERLVLLQEHDAWQSAVLSRFEAGGTRIQIVQHLWGMAVVIRPREGVSAKEAGPDLLGRYFLEADRMVDPDASELPGMPQPFRMWLAADPRGCFRWWQWYACYTDGLSLAVWMPRVAELTKLVVFPGDPWF